MTYYWERKATLKLQSQLSVIAYCDRLTEGLLN